MHRHIIFGSILFFLFSFESRAELICIHPVPLAIKELMSKQKAGAITEEVLQLNSEYLITKYCGQTQELPLAQSSVALGDDCEMKWGQRLGETVYWASCKTSETRAPATPKTPNADKNRKDEKPKHGVAQHNNKRRSSSQLSCCLRYYQGEKSLEGWGPAERCRRNMASMKYDWCAADRAQTRQRKTGKDCGPLIKMYREGLASGEWEYASDAAKYIRRQCHIN